jgi:hypothetical protein
VKSAAAKKPLMAVFSATPPRNEPPLFGAPTRLGDRRLATDPLVDGRVVAGVRDDVLAHARQRGEEGRAVLERGLAGDGVERLAKSSTKSAKSWAEIPSPACAVGMSAHV